jgi:phosphohistidine phosphatase
VKLYLVQHAKAISEQADPQRPLTEEGRRDIEKVAAFIKPLKLSIDYLWHSSKLRAMQTAQVLAKAITINKSITARDGLGPNDDVSAIQDELLAMGEDVMIVGHLPFLGKLASVLLTGSESANTVAFKNAGILCLNLPEGNCWQIEWMIIPELILNSDFLVGDRMKGLK